MRKFKRIRSSDLAAFCWQLTTMVRGGITVANALESIIKDMENAQLREVLVQVLEELRRGQTFSDSIAKFPKVFDTLFCSMIMAGETGGTLPESLQRLATYLDNRDKLAKKVKTATAYPAFVLGFIILIMSDAWIMPYQCTYFLLFRELTSKQKLYNRTKFLQYNFLTVLFRLAAIYASIPFWRYIGIL